MLSSAQLSPPPLGVSLSPENTSSPLPLHAFNLTWTYDALHHCSMTKWVTLIIRFSIFKSTWPTDLKRWLPMRVSSWRKGNILVPSAIPCLIPPFVQTPGPEECYHWMQSLNSPTWGVIEGDGERPHLHMAPSFCLGVFPTPGFLWGRMGWGYYPGMGIQKEERVLRERMMIQSLATMISKCLWANQIVMLLPCSLSSRYMHLTSVHPYRCLLPVSLITHFRRCTYSLACIFVFDSARVWSVFNLSTCRAGSVLSTSS